MRRWNGCLKANRFQRSHRDGMYHAIREAHCRIRVETPPRQCPSQLCVVGGVSVCEHSQFHALSTPCMNSFRHQEGYSTYLLYRRSNKPMTEPSRHHHFHHHHHYQHRNGHSRQDQECNVGRQTDRKIQPSVVALISYLCSITRIFSGAAFEKGSRMWILTDMDMGMGMDVPYGFW